MGGIGSEYDPRITREALSDPAVLLPLLGLVLPNVRVGDVRFGVRQGLGQAGQLYEFLRTRGAQEAEAKRVQELMTRWQGGTPQTGASPTALSSFAVQPYTLQGAPGTEEAELVPAAQVPTLQEQLAKIPKQPLPSLADVLGGAPDRYRRRAFLAPSVSGGTAPIDLYTKMAASQGQWLDQTKDLVLREALKQWRGAADDETKSLAEQAMLSLLPAEGAREFAMDRQTRSEFGEYARLNGLSNWQQMSRLPVTVMSAEFQRLMQLKENARLGQTILDQLTPGERQIWAPYVLAGGKIPDEYLSDRAKRTGFVEGVTRHPELRGLFSENIPLSQTSYGRMLQDPTVDPMFVSQQQTRAVQYQRDLEQQRFERGMQAARLGLESEQTALARIRTETDKLQFYLAHYRAMATEEGRQLQHLNAISLSALSKEEKQNLMRAGMKAYDQARKEAQTALGLYQAIVSPEIRLATDRMEMPRRVQEILGGKEPPGQKIQALERLERDLREQLPALVGIPGYREFADQLFAEVGRAKAEMAKESVRTYPRGELPSEFEEVVPKPPPLRFPPRVAPGP